MGLRFVVVTAVARDDLPDGGAAHFADVIAAMRERLPGCGVEVLIPDLRGSWDALDAIIEAAPDVLNHNTETVPRLYSRVRPGARYERTLELLARSAASGLTTKSGIMVGLGETLRRSVGPGATWPRWVRPGDVGQYLRPSAAHLPVARYYAPAEYPAIAAAGRRPGSRARRGGAAGALVVRGGPGRRGGARGGLTARPGGAATAHRRRLKSRWPGSIPQAHLATRATTAMDGGQVATRDGQGP